MKKIDEYVDLGQLVSNEHYKDSILMENNILTNCGIRQINNCEEIKQVLNKFDKLFEPALSERAFKLDDFANKLSDNALVYIVKDRETMAFIAFYANNNDKIAYLTLIAVLKKYQKMKIGKVLLELCIKIAKSNGMNELRLEVNNCNIIAKRFYAKNGFVFSKEASKDSVYMKKCL